MAKDTIGMIANILLIIGGLNWGLYAFGYNLVSYLNFIPMLDTIVYVLVALSALYVLYKTYMKK
jgi:uncharacterized membrane protein YuzA (DUF378 family)